MSVRKIIATIILSCFTVLTSAAQPEPVRTGFFDNTLLLSIARALGWIDSSDNNCCGYFMDEAFIYPVNYNDPYGTVSVKSQKGTISLQGTSVLEDEVLLTRFNQQIKADKAYLYRDPTTHKLSAVDLLKNVYFREPNTVVLGDYGFYDFNTEKKKLTKVYYRTALNNRKFVGATAITPNVLKQSRRIYDITAWGSADQFLQNQPLIYDLDNTTFTTCSPFNPVWQIRASYINLNKNTGRGYATNARFLVKGVPVFYTPYFNFSIDRQRKSGLLWPKLGYTTSWGYYGLFPYYWNMAPNYDMIITPSFLSDRGFMLSDYFRYLTTTSRGSINFSGIPEDKGFNNFQKQTREKAPIVINTQPQSITNAEVQRLLTANSSRFGFSWQDNSRYNIHWSSFVDFSYASDDYFYRDFGHNLNQVTQNQLLQEADVYYKGENWGFTGRLQGYQTLHPYDEAFVYNQYRRFPQLILFGEYPDQAFGLTYFIQSELTNFTLLQNPGYNVDQPVGGRLNAQPGISLPLFWPAFYITPRAQVALTSYQLWQTRDTETPKSINRAVPIFDVVAGFGLERDISFLKYQFKQTLEPQFYYTYIPYRDQKDIPVFDTTVSTLLYDQIFKFNRFSGLDRIGDANQLGVGVTTRFIDRETGLEKIRAGVGQIYYFADRKVTLCNSSSLCSDYPGNPTNEYRLSPLTGYINVTVSPVWSISTNALWNPITKQLDNSTATFHYQTDNQHLFNFSYTYARGGDVLSGIVTENESENNLKVTTVSFALPLFTSDLTLVGLWSQNWNHQHLQNLLYGLQYDTCCWAVRAVGGKAFVKWDTQVRDFKYDTQFYLEVSLKGVGNIGNGSPDRLLASITGYNTQFGQEL